MQLSLRHKLATRHFRCKCLLLLAAFFMTEGLGRADEYREWSDATGRFKITAKLIEVRDGAAILENQDGKTVKIPTSRLSKADQEFLEGGDNPFEMVEADTATAPASTAATETSIAASGNAGGGWNSPKTVSFDDAEEISTMAGVEWSVTPPNGELGFEAKRTPLPKKNNFHEWLHALAVNAKVQRAVVAHTSSFAVPKPMSRIALVDLTTGKAVHSELIESNMRPLALLDNGTAVVMVGAADPDSGYETGDQLQVWRLQGKKIARTPSWIPYPNDKEDWGKQMNAVVVMAQPINDKLMMTLSDKGHLVVWDIAKREPIWHLRMNDRNFAAELSTDRSLLAVADDKTLMILKPETGEILGSTAVVEPANMGWNRIAWSPNGKKILFTSVSSVRVLNVETGAWDVDFQMNGGPIAANGLSYPHDDFALLNNSLLLHLPTKIQVCQYDAAQQITTLGGTSFIALQDQGGGIVVPAKFPHPTASELLEKAQKDPTVFLIHPGVGVAIDASGAGQFQAEVRAGLEKAAVNSGYKVDPSSQIKLVGSVSGPKPEAVSYIGEGSHVVNAYQSTIKLVWNGKDLWTTGGTNVPGFLMTSGDETLEQALEKAGQSPNLGVFEGSRFPEFMQRPSENAQGGNAINALMSAKFTLQGLIDSK